jgi:iron complex outermembrane receptor protein
MIAKNLLNLGTLLTLLLFLLQSARSQNRVITGTVIDSSDGSHIQNVSVLANGTNIGTQTDAKGYFVLTVPLSVKTLTLSAVGFAPRDVGVSTARDINIALVSTSSTLNEVVVIGYGTAKKKDLTGAIGSVSEKNFNKGIFTSPDQLLLGKVSGLQITNNNGQPGGAATIKIRGNSALSGTGQPLYVIDGVPLDGRTLAAGIDPSNGLASPNLSSVQTGVNPLNFINPDDIASIDILKDASATAIYGSRASYGVVIINTKKGQAGKTKLEGTSSIGVSSIMKKIKILNADQYREAIKYYNVSNLNDKGGNIDALDAILQNGFQQNYTIAVSGGNENGKYRVSVNLLDKDGIIRNTAFKKYGLDLSTNFKFLESKKLGLDLNVNSNQYIQEVPLPLAGSSGLIQSALQWNPTDSLRKADGSLNIFAGDKVNPLALTQLIKDNLKVTTVAGSFSPYYKFTDWLEYKLLVSINYSTGIARSSFNQALNPSDPRGRASITNKELSTQQITQTLNFNKEISPGLNLDAVAGYEFMKFKMKGFSLTGNGVQDRGFGNYGLDYTNYVQYSDVTGRNIFSSVDPKTELQSFFGRTIFNYKDKYLLTATFRADGSSKFGENNKYGYFPSFAAAWNIYKEKFFKLRFVNSLKVRAGWGKTGNQEFPSGSAQARYSFQNNGSIIQVNSPNPDLKWQSDKQYNIGIDFSIFNSRISGTFDYFNKITTSLLFPSPPIQPAPPLSVVRWINLDGKIINKGFEALINAAVVRNEKFSWDLSVNATFLKNNVSDMPSTISNGWLQGSGVGGASVEVIQNGLPINSFYTRKFLGMDKATGLAIYQDDGATFYYVGDPNPKTLLGISSTLQYKKFSLTANMYGAFGQDIFYNTLLNIINVAGINALRNIALSVYKDPVKESFANPVTPSSRFVVKGNYIKMANLTVSYNLDNVAKAFRGAKIYVTGQNLFIITRYPGFDPEANFDGSNNGVPSLGIDYAQYPSSRTLIFGINFSL